MKKISAAVISLVLFFSFFSPEFCDAASNPYYYHDCTWMAWQCAHDYLGITLPAWGYAENWCKGAQRDGYATGTIPAANAVMVWYGHVGFITQVSADGRSVYIIEGGWGDGEDDWWHQGWYADGGTSSSGKSFIGYVYLDSVPADTNPGQSDPFVSRSTETKESDSSDLSGSSDSNGHQNIESSELPDSVREQNDTQREKELAQLREKKENLGIQIKETETEIADLKQQLDQTNQENEERVRTMYMFGNESYLEVLFSSESLSDFCAKAELISDIIAMDREMIRKIEGLSEEITAKKAELEQSLAELEAMTI